jgi:hypothetical protein
LTVRNPAHEVLATAVGVDVSYFESAGPGGPVPTANFDAGSWSDVPGGASVLHDVTSLIAKVYTCPRRVVLKPD